MLADVPFLAPWRGFWRSHWVVAGRGRSWLASDTLSTSLPLSHLLSPLNRKEVTARPEAAVRVVSGHRVRVPYVPWSIWRSPAQVALISLNQAVLGPTCV